MPKAPLPPELERFVRAPRPAIERWHSFGDPENKA
jgi:hypothetical protein